ncbi:MAG: hypothetical protein ABI947_19350 [Chloroflexota bacterium]
MWHKLHDTLKGYVPLMIGAGTIILVIDSIVFFLHRLLGLDKGTAFYLAVLLLCCIAYLALYHQAYHPQPDEADSETSQDR